MWQHRKIHPPPGEVYDGYIVFYSYVDPIHSWHLTQQLNKEDLDLCTWAFRWCLCPVKYGSYDLSKKTHKSKIPNSNCTASASAAIVSHPAVSSLIVIAPPFRRPLCFCWRTYKKHKRKKGAKQEPVLCLVGRWDTSCFSWKDKTGIYSVSCKDVTWRYPKAKPCGQTTWTKDTKDTRRYVQVAKRYVRNKDESNQVSTR